MRSRYTRIEVGSSVDGKEQLSLFTQFLSATWKNAFGGIEMFAVKIITFSFHFNNSSIGQKSPENISQ